MSALNFPLKWYTRPVDQGQMVEISYAYDREGGAYRRVHDRSDNTTCYSYGDLDWTRESEGFDENDAPCVEEWIPCDPPEES